MDIDVWTVSKTLGHFKIPIDWLNGPNLLLGGGNLKINYECTRYWVGTHTQRWKILIILPNGKLQVKTVLFPLIVTSRERKDVWKKTVSNSSLKT